MTTAPTTSRRRLASLATLLVAVTASLSARADTVTLTRDLTPQNHGGATYGVAIDPSTGHLWVAYATYSASEAAILEVDPTTGAVLNSFTPPAAPVGQIGMDLVPVPFVLGNVSLPANTLLVGADCPGYACKSVYAVSKTDGSTLAHVDLMPPAGSSYLSGGGIAYHVARGTLFFADDFGERVIEYAPATGAFVQQFSVSPPGHTGLAFNFSGLDVNQANGHIYVTGGGFGIRELTADRNPAVEGDDHFVQDYLDPNLFAYGRSDIAFDETTGAAWVSTYAGSYPLSLLNGFPADACPDDPDKTAPGACGCGQPDVDSNNNGKAECLYTMTMFDTAGTELPDATFALETGYQVPAGGALRFEQGTSVRFKASWKNASQWSEFFAAPTSDATVPTLHLDVAPGSVELASVTPGHGLRIDAVLDRGPVTVIVRDQNGDPLPSTDAFGNYHGPAAVSTDFPYVFSGGSGSSGEVAYGYQMYFRGAWSAASIWKFLVPQRDHTSVLHGSTAGYPVTESASTGAFIVFEYDKITVTLDLATASGQPIPGATIGTEGFGRTASPFRFEAPSSPGQWFYRLAWYHPTYGTFYPFAYPTRDATLTLAGTNPESFVASGGQTIHAVFPDPDLCPDDPNKTAPGACGCGVIDSPCGCGVPAADADADGKAECPVHVSVYDQHGAELTGAIVRLESGVSAATGGALTFELDNPLYRVAVIWQNANFWSAFFAVSSETSVPTVHADGSVTFDTVAAGGGLRLRAVVPTHDVTYDLVDASGAPLPATDAFGITWSNAAVGDVQHGLASPSGTTFTVADGFPTTVYARWRNGSIARYVDLPGVGQTLTIHGSQLGAPTEVTASATSRIAFELDRATLTIAARDSHGLAIADATTGLDGAMVAAPYRVEVAASPSATSEQPFLVYIAGAWPGHYAARSIYVSPVRGASLTIDGTSGVPQSSPAAGTDVTFAYPAAITCGDGFVEGGETCDDGNAVSGDCCSATCALEAAGSACGNPTDDACTNPDTCDGQGACLANDDTADLDGNGVRDCLEGGVCTVEQAICGADGAGGSVLWGVLELDGGGLAAFRCVVQAEGGTPVCDTQPGTDILKTFPPKCE